MGLPSFTADDEPGLLIVLILILFLLIRFRCGGGLRRLRLFGHDVGLLHDRNMLLVIVRSLLLVRIVFFLIPLIIRGSWRSYRRSGRSGSHTLSRGRRIDRGRRSGFSFSCSDGLVDCGLNSQRLLWGCLLGTLRGSLDLSVRVDG